MAFNINAQVVLSGPKNIQKVRTTIQKQLSGINVPVKLTIDKNAAAGLGGISKQISALNTNLSKLNATAKTSSNQFSALANAGTTLNNNNSKLQKGFNDIGKSISGVGKEAKKAGSEIEEFGKDAALAVRRFSAFTIATGAVFGFVRAVQDGIKEAISFERELARVVQVTGAGKSELEGLNSTITNLSKSLGINANELASVSVTLAQTGQSIQEVRKSLDAIAKANLAPTFGSLKDTTEGVIAALNQFNISADRTEAVLGSLNAVSKRFAVESEDLISVIRRAGGVFATAAGDFGKPEEALAELLGIFTAVRSTTRETADTIATGLRTIFSRLQRRGTIDFLKQFNIELLDAEGRFVGFFEAFRRISDGLTDLQKKGDTITIARVVEELGGIRQIGKILPALQNFRKAEEARKVALEGTESITKDVAIATQTLAVQIEKLQARFQSLIRDIAQSQTFQNLAKFALSAANAFLTVAETLTPLLPLFATFAGIKITGAAFQFGKGFIGGLKKGGGAGGVGEGIAGALTGTGRGDATKDTVAKQKVNNALVKNTSALGKNTTALKTLTSAVKELKTATSQSSTQEKLQTTQTQRLITAITTLPAKIAAATTRLNPFGGGGSRRGKGRSFAAGGQIPKFANGGFVNGPSHAQGGVIAELEGGEFVVPKQKAQKLSNGGRAELLVSGGRFGVATLQPVEGQKGSVDFAQGRSLTNSDVIGKISSKLNQGFFGAIQEKDESDVTDAEIENAKPLRKDGNLNAPFKVFLQKPTALNVPKSQVTKTYKGLTAEQQRQQQAAFAKERRGTKGAKGIGAGLVAGAQEQVFSAIKLVANPKSIPAVKPSEQSLQAGLIDEFEQLTKDGLEGLTSKIIASPSIKNIGPDGKLDIPDGIISENIDALFKADPEGKLNSAGQAIQGYLLEAIIGTLSNLTPESSGANFDFKNVADAGGLEGLADLYGPDGANILAALSAFDAKARNKALEDSIAGKVGSFLANDVTERTGSSGFAQINKLFEKRFASGGQVPVAISNKEGLIDPETANKNLPLLERARQGFGSAISEIAKKNIKIGEVSGPGTGTSDSIKTTLSSGTFVLPKRTMDSLKSQRFASGGRVGFPGGGRVGGVAKGLEVADLIQDFVALSFVVNGLVSTFSGGFDLASLLNTVGILSFSLDSFTGVLDRGKKVFESTAKAQAKSAAAVTKSSKIQRGATNDFRKSVNNIAAELFSGKAGRGNAVLTPFGPSPEERRKRRGRDRQRLSREEFREKRIKGVRSRLKERRARLRSGQTPAQFRQFQDSLVRKGSRGLNIRSALGQGRLAAKTGSKFVTGSVLAATGFDRVIGKTPQKGLAPKGGTTLKGAVSRGLKPGIAGIVASLLVDPIANAARKAAGETQRGDARGFEENGRLKAGGISGLQGAASGALLGSSVGALTGPFAPVLVPLFAALGGLTGAITGVIDGLTEQAKFDLFKNLEEEAIGLVGALDELGDDFRDASKLSKATKAQEVFFKSTLQTVEGFNELNNGLRTAIDRLSVDNPSSLFNPGRLFDGVGDQISEGARKLREKFEEAAADGNSLGESAATAAEFLEGFGNGIENTIDGLNDAIENNPLVIAFSKAAAGILKIGLQFAADFSDASAGGQGFVSNVRARTFGSRLPILDEAIGLFTGRSGKTVARDRAARDQAFISQGQKVKGFKSFEQTSLVLPREALAKSQEQFEGLISTALSDLSLDQLEALGDISSISLEELGDRIQAVGGTAVETSKSFRAFQKSAALLAGTELVDTVKKITDQEDRTSVQNANLRAAAQSLNQSYLDALNEGVGSKQAGKIAALNFQESIQAGLKTSGGPFRNLDTKDIIGNFDSASLDSFQEALSKIDGSTEEGAAKLQALANAAGVDNIAQLNVFLDQWQATTGESLLTFAQADAAQNKLAQSLRGLVKEFDALASALNQLANRTANAVSDLGIAFGNVNNKIAQIQSTEQSVVPIQRVNPFENLAGRTDTELRDGITRIAAATGQTDGQFEGVAETLSFQRDASQILKRTVDQLARERGGNISAANVGEQEFLDAFTQQAGPAFQKLPEGIRKSILDGLTQTFAGTRQGGATNTSVGAIKTALESGEGSVESIIGEAGEQLREQVAGITSALNTLEAQILESANIQQQIIQTRAAAAENEVARRQELESRLSRFVVQNINQRQLAEKNLRQRLETIASAGGQIGLGGTNVLDGQQLLQRQSDLRAEREDLLSRAGQDVAGAAGSGQTVQDAINDAIQNGNTDLADKLAQNSAALEGTNRALEELGNDVTRLEAVESELARIQEARLTQRQRAALFASRLGSAKDQKGRAEVLNELLKGVNAAGKIKKGESIGFDEAAAILQDPQTVFDALGISNDKVAQEQLLATVTEGIKGQAAAGTGVAGELATNQFLGPVGQGTAQTLADRLFGLGATVQGTTGAEQQGINELKTLTEAQIQLVNGAAENNAKAIEKVFEVLRAEIDLTLLKVQDAGKAFAETRGLLDNINDQDAAQRDFRGSGVPNAAGNLSLGRPFDPDTPRRSAGPNLSLGRDPDPVPNQGNVFDRFAELGRRSPSRLRQLPSVPITLGGSDESESRQRFPQQSAQGQVVPIGPLTRPTSTTQDRKPVISFGNDPEAPAVPLGSLNRRASSSEAELNEFQRARQRSQGRFEGRSNNGGGQVVPIGPLGRGQGRKLGQDAAQLNTAGEKIVEGGQEINTAANNLNTALQSQLGVQLNTAADKLATLPDLQVSLNANVGPVEVILNGGSIIENFGNEVRGEILAQVAAELNRRGLGEQGYQDTSVT